jgi:succinylglutamic semialdehyde dehydrogenase
MTMTHRPTMVSRDPATGEVVWTGAASTPDGVGGAIEAAGAAFVRSDWADATFAHRAAVAERFAARLRERKAALSEIISRETGKPRWESATEVDSMIAKVAISIRAIDERRRPTQRVNDDGATSATRYRPHGVVAVIGPFNFPGHLPNGHIVPALLAGNTVVFKPSELTPWTAEATLDAWREAGLPKDVIRIVQGGRDVGEALVRHADVAGVFFTGSRVAGVAIHRALADRPEVITALEMGGNNPLIVWDVTDVTAAAYLTVLSAYITAGERCSCARRLIVQSGAAGDRFLEALVALMARVRVGRYVAEPEPFMGPVISTSAAERLLAAQDELVALGGRAIVPMRPLNAIKTMLTPGLIDATSVREQRDEEHFGPLLQIRRVDDFGKAIAEANETRFGLSAGLLSDERALYDRFRREVRAGVMSWNRPMTGASSALPFGGIGHSGNHRPSGFFAADYCSDPVASLEAERVTMPAKPMPGIMP